MTPKPHPSELEPEADTREKLLRAATALFAEKGFDGATVKEIAEQAGVNISLISYHFNGKEGVFRACLERFGREALLDAEKILLPAENATDLRLKLRLWAEQFLLCQVEETDVCSILHRESVEEHPFLWEVFESTFLKAFEALAHFLEAGKKKGIVRKDVDSTLAASFLYGSLVHLARHRETQQRWMGISIQNEKYRTQVADQSILILLHGITGEEK
jgi:AcrR family transcriptional regulator